MERVSSNPSSITIAGTQKPRIWIRPSDNNSTFLSPRNENKFGSSNSRRFKSRKDEQLVVIRSEAPEENEEEYKRYEINLLASIPTPSSQEHPLKNSWIFWYNRIHGSRSADNYEKHMKVLSTFNSVEGFWCCYSHLVRPNDLPPISDFYIFKFGIKPMWEVVISSIHWYTLYEIFYLHL